MAKRKRKSNGSALGNIWAVLGILATLAGLITFLVLDVPEISRRLAQQRQGPGGGVPPDSDAAALTAEAATATSAPLAGQVLPLPDFENGRDQGWQVLEGEWTTAGGYLVPANELGGTIVGGDPSWMDYSLEVDVFSTGEAGRFTAAILLRVRDRDNYVALVAERGCQKVGWEVVRGGSRDEQKSTSVQCTPPFRVRVTVSGSTYQALIDGEPVATLEDTTFSAGRIGLRSHSADTPPGADSLAAFDNLRVELK